MAVGMTLFFNIATFTQRAATSSSGVIVKTSHNMPNGTEVSFRSLTGLSGIVVNRRYFVVNATTDSFQVSETEGGAIVPIIGSGSCIYSAFPKVEEIGTTWIRVTFQNENTSPTTSTTTTYSMYKKDLAIHKGWAI